MASGVDHRGRPDADGDIVVAVNGMPVDSGAALTSHLNSYRPGDKIKLTVIRNGDEVAVLVTLGDWPRS